TVEQWISGIARRGVQSFLRKERRRHSLLLLTGDLPLDVATDATQETHVAKHDLENQMFSFLPPEERVVVIRQAHDGNSLRGIAADEGISVSTAVARYDRGMQRLKQLNDERKSGMPFPVPAGFFAEGRSDTSGPPPELFERTWRRAVELGL